MIFIVGFSDFINQESVELNKILKIKASINMVETTN